MDCFAALAMTWNSRRDFTTSPRNAPEPLINLSPKEGVGNAGCPLHPRPRVHFVLVERTRVTTESPGIPARIGRVCVLSRHKDHQTITNIDRDARNSDQKRPRLQPTLG